MSRRLELNFTKPQAWAHNAFQLRGDDPITVTMPWGRGSGKSWFERTEGLWLSVAQWDGKLRRKLSVDADGNVTDFGSFHGVRIIGLCPTLKQFRDIHGFQLEIENSGEWSFLGGKLNRSTLRLEFPGGSWFQPMPAAVASSKSGLGMRCDIVLPDEVDDIANETYDTVSRPWFSEPWSLKRTLAGGTPRRGRHGLLYRLHQAGLSTDPADARYFSKLCTWRDSPELVSVAEVEDARRHMAPSTFAREWECDFDAAEGLVYPFEEDFHVREPPPPNQFSEFFLGVDHGWNDPGCFLLCGLQGRGEDSVLWVLEEIYKRETPNHVWDSIARERFRGMKCYPDPSRPDRIDDLRKCGLKCQSVDNSIEAGVARVASLLFKRLDENGPPWCRLYVSPDCVNCIREFKSYRRKADPKAIGSFLEDIVDKDNHSLDPLRYIALGVFGPVPSRGNYRNEAPGR